MEKIKLDTPCLVIDKTKLEKNLTLLQQHVRQANKSARPHIKTHKCTQLAKRQIEQGAIGVSAAKVSEALVLSRSGIKNTLITSPVVTTKKIQHLVECRKLDDDLILVCDSEQNAKDINQAMKENHLTLNILVDIDPGVARTGISHEKASELAHFIHQQCSHLTLLGIQCYAGNLQHISSFNERQQATLSVMKKASKTKQALIEQGLPCSILSGSGTGTYAMDMTLNDITEVQPGSYAVMDMEYRNIACADNPKQFSTFIPAMTMLVTVISANHPTHVTVDAGTKSLYFDPVTKPFIISHPGLHYDWAGFGDEHGKVTAEKGYALPKVGDVIELIVPHCDPTINLHNKFYVTDNEHVIDCWDIDMRGCVK